MASQRPFYDVELKMGSLDISQHVRKVTIVNTIRSVCQIFFISLLLDSQDVVGKEVYGNTPLSLVVRMMTEDIQEQVNLAYDLNIVKVISEQPQRAGEDDHGMSTPVSLIAVPIKPWDYMTTTVNYLAENRSAKYPLEVAKNIVNTFLGGVTKNIVDKGVNKVKPEQIIVPPVPFSAAMRYLDTKYGIYQGQLFFQCLEENGSYHLPFWDLAKRIEDPEIYTIWDLPRGGIADDDIYKKTGISDTMFYTRDPIDFKSNMDGVVTDSYENSFVMKPSDAFYTIKTITADKLQQSGHLPKDIGDLVIPPTMKEKSTRIHTRGYVGVGEDETTLISRLAGKYAFQSQAKLFLDRNVRITNMMKVGIPVMIKTHLSTYSRSYGKYLIGASRVVISRTQSIHFICNVELRAFRSNPLTN
jgi:hypothetical protein